MERYAAKAGRLNTTAATCAAHGVRYLPVVFTAQGVAVLAKLVEIHTGATAAEIKRQTLQEISTALAKFSVRAVARRGPRHLQPFEAPGTAQHLAEALSRGAVGSTDAWAAQAEDEEDTADGEAPAPDREEEEGQTG